jgi:hypothetical protein
MKSLNWLAFALLFFISSYPTYSQPHGSYHAIYSGTPRFDDHGNIVSAHGGCIIKDNGRYYFFGEIHNDTTNAFSGFSCYSSTDLYNWKFENIALPVQDTGKLGANRVGERVKVMKCPATGEYVMYMHADNLAYKDQYIGYATAKTITGPYKFHGPLLFKGKPVKKWDIGAFQDSDGSGYILVHGGDIYKLSDNYTSIAKQVLKNMSPDSESPAMFKKGGIYYWLGSHRTSWERNDNFYYTATSLKGPWVAHGNFAPKGTLTWDSQTTYVFPVIGPKDTTFMFMGDRWSYPRQASAATYVWQPISISGESITISKYKTAWQINLPSRTKTAAPGQKFLPNTDKRISYFGNWQPSKDTTIRVKSSDTKNDSCSIKISGTQIGLYCLAQPTGGYAQVKLRDSKGETILSCIIDTYCNYTAPMLKFMSPVLPKDTYTLTVYVMGEHGNWSDKRKSTYGSKGNFIAIDKIMVNDPSAQTHPKRHHKRTIRGI